MLITERDLRARLSRGERAVHIAPGDIVTQAARDYIKSNRFAVTEGPAPAEQGAFRDADGNECREKPEGMTHLRGDLLVPKTHPRIALRGKLDSLQAQIIDAQVTASEQGCADIVEGLSDLLSWIREILACEVRDVPFSRDTLLGMKELELRDASHHPDRSVGIGHFLPDHRHGRAASALNLVRTAARETELAAAAAFTAPDGRCEREDLIRALNRSSSAVYLLLCKHVAKTANPEEVQPWTNR